MSISNVKPLIPFPALLIEEDAESILVVGDLHIGWELSLTDRGIFIPSQVSRIQARLLQLIEEYKPTRLIFLGDVKEAIPMISLEEWKDVPEFFEAMQKAVGDVSVTLGNHDGDLEPLTPPNIKILPSSGIVVGKNTKIGLFHGHAWPSPEVISSDLLIMGHVHPVIWFRDKMDLWTVRQVWVKAKCEGDKLAKAYLKYRKIKPEGRAKEVLKEKFQVEVSDAGLIIIPAFNDLVGGLSINRLEKGLMGPILGSGVVDMEAAEVYLLDGTYIGVVKQLRNYTT
ncbi:MAG: Phosphoesterase [Thermoproteota archaeon]|nr:Phosphoesterase [Thermoproteota archaeon]